MMSAIDRPTGMRAEASGPPDLPSKADGETIRPVASTVRSHVYALVLKIALSVLLLGAVFYRVDLSVAWQHAGDQDLGLIFAALVMILGQIVFGALRWRTILVRLGGRVKLRDALRLFYASVFFNAFLIGGFAGDAARMWLTYRAGVDASTAAKSVIVDRIAALAGVAVLVIVTAPLFLLRAGTEWMTFAPIAVALVGLAGIVVAAQLNSLPPAWLRWRPLRMLQALGGATRAVFMHRSAVPTLALAAAAQTSMAFAVFLIARSLKIEVSALDCLVLMQPVALATALPISIGGWGVREGAIIALFGLIGISSAAALVLSVQVGLVTMLASLPGGLFCFGWSAARSRNADRGAPAPTAPSVHDAALARAGARLPEPRCAGR
jgi:glycosyltransferase 2 family protein